MSVYDLIVRHGIIIDGSGAPAFTGDVAVRDGKIAAIGQVSGQARRVIDAKGLVVAPGFVDIHTHYDHQVLWDPLLTSSCWHGVTTVVTGNCGFTIAPCKPEHRDYIMHLLARVEGMSIRAMQEGPAWGWESFGQFLQQVEHKLALNIACQVGHSAVRLHAMGEDAGKRRATADEIATMKRVVRESLEAGAVGFTTSLARTHVDWDGNPIPSRLSDLPELLELASVVGEFGFGAVGLAPRSGMSLEDEDETLRLAKASGRVVAWNEWHDSPRAPGRWKEVGAFMERAHAEGARVYGTVSCRPATQDWDMLENHMVVSNDPAWSRLLHHAHQEKLRLMADPVQRAHLRDAISKAWDTPANSRWDSTIVSGLRPEHAEYKGLTLRQLGQRTGTHPVDAMFDLALTEDLKTRFTFLGTRNRDPEIVGEMMRSPYSILGVSDGGAHVNMVAGAEYTTQVLGHWVRVKKALTLEHAVHKLTWAPAQLYGFTDRGLLKPGMAADIVAFDPDTISPLDTQRVHDLPGGEERITVGATGIACTIVNGVPLMEHGQHTGVYPGKLLRSTDYTGATRR